MKRLTAVLLALVLMVSALAGCGAKKDAKKNNEPLWEAVSGDSNFNAGISGTPSQDGSSDDKEDSSKPSNTDKTDKNDNGSSKDDGSYSDDDSDDNVNNTTDDEEEYEEEEEIKDISGSSLTQDGVEKIISTQAITSEYSLPAFQKLTYTHTNGKKMCYSLRLPANYDENKKYPVLMFLHGIKQVGSNWDSVLHLASLYQYNADIVNDAILVAPQAPNMDLWQMTNDGTGAMAYSLLTKVIEKDYSVDMNRIYLTGLSMGGIGTWGMLEEHPDHFAAASPICGMGNPAKADVLKNIPIWAWHGTADTTVNYNASGATPKMYDAIVAAGGNKMIFSKLQGEGHNAWDPAFKSREHLSWLFSQVKGKHQSKEYSMIPYLTVVDASGKVVLSEKDAASVTTREGSGKDSGKRDIVLTLTKEGNKKLSDAYTKSGGKTFTVYFGNQQIMTFTATKKTEGRMFVLRDIFTNTGYSTYYSKLLTTVGRK